MDINAKTKLCAIIGSPVEHSMSPAMFNAAFNKLDLNYAYTAFTVLPERLPEAVKGLKALNIMGFNVTIPHKVAVVPLLDKLDPLAEKIGAVNTVVNKDGKLWGYNTDAEGFIRALIDHSINPVRSKITVLGAGGASRAVSYALVERNARLTILNRRAQISKAQNIAAMIQKELGKTVKVIEMENLAEGIKGTEILINATSVGMSPYPENSPVPAVLLKNVPVVFDIVYNPMETRLLKEAKKAGAETIGGMEMLVWQGALAFEKMTGQKAPLDIMRHEAVKMLERE